MIYSNRFNSNQNIDKIDENSCNVSDETGISSISKTKVD